MNKPNGYDEAQVVGEREKIELGGHYAIVKQVSEKKSSNGKDMIVVLFDFCSPDKQEGYFMDAFKKDVREDKKWPFQGSKYIMVNDYNEDKKTSKGFKTFCSCIEKSNNMNVSWGGPDWGKQFVGKKIGVVYGNEEQEYEGKTFMRETVKWFCGVDAVADAKIPDPKYLSDKAPAPTTDDGFMAIPDSTEEEIPF